MISIEKLSNKIKQMFLNLKRFMNFKQLMHELLVIGDTHNNKIWFIRNDVNTHKKKGICFNWISSGELRVLCHSGGGGMENNKNLNLNFLQSN